MIRWFHVFMSSCARPNLPDVVRRYFDAMNRHQIDAVVASFSPDATVEDQFGDHTGHVAIAAWLQDVTQRYEPTAIVLGVKSALTGLALRVSVSGRFPGSPVQLDFHFRLCAGKITKLTIEE